MQGYIDKAHTAVLIFRGLFQTQVWITFYFKVISIYRYFLSSYLIFMGKLVINCQRYAQILQGMVVGITHSYHELCTFVHEVCLNLK